jgi:hypothetical protein
MNSGTGVTMATQVPAPLKSSRRSTLRFSDSN